MYEELIEGCIIKAKSNELFSFSNWMLNYYDQTQKKLNSIIIVCVGLNSKLNLITTLALS